MSLDDVKINVTENIEERKIWSCIAVDYGECDACDDGRERAGHPWTYTVGLHKNFNHPEIIVFGLPMQSAHSLLNDIGLSIKENGNDYTEKKDYNDLVENFPIRFIEVPKFNYRGFFNIAKWYYDGDGFDAIQLVWPDTSGLFEWEEGFNEDMSKFQPLLGEPWWKEGD